MTDTIRRIVKPLRSSPRSAIPTIVRRMDDSRVCEMKTELTSIEETIRPHDVKARLAASGIAECEMRAAILEAGRRIAPS